MAQATTDNKTKAYRSGTPMSDKALADYQKVWTDIKEAIAYCEKHPVKK